MKCGGGLGDQADGGADAVEDDVLQGVDAQGVPGSCESNSEFA